MIGQKTVPSGTIVRDQWARHVPGRRRVPVQKRRFSVPIQKATGTADIREALSGLRTFWTPGKATDPAGVPAAQIKGLRARMKSVDPRLALAFNPKEKLYGVWIEAPQIQTEWCKGWKLLFSVKPEFLDDRILWKLYESDTTRFGGAKKAFDAFERAAAANQVKTEMGFRQDARDWASDYFDHTRPQVSGYGQSFGAKFAKHN